jgi:septal ring factor EnvC (AmiA/AmiB activator)
MKVKFALLVLIAVCVALGVALLATQRKAEEQRQTDTRTIHTLTNQLDETRGRLAEQQRVNAVLETNLYARIAEVNQFSNLVVIVSNALQRTQAEAKAAAEASAAELAKRDEKIAQLETERENLDKKLIALNAEIASLNIKIADTERKLAASEGDREFLLKELRRLQAEKSDLERQFNDVAVMRQQVNRLQEELAIARRLEWIRKGLSGDVPKGAVLMQQGLQTAAPQVRTNVMEVEITTQGGVRVSAPTNAAPGAPKAK